MNKSETIKNLADALAKAQAEMPVVKMNAQNPFLKNRYADLGAVIEASRPTLAKHGLSISQMPTSDGDKIGVTSILMHASGEWLEETILIPTTDNKGLSVAQSAGVVISYLRRYSWAAILGLYADEDTDGSHPKAEQGKTAPPEKPTVPPQAAMTMTLEQALAIKNSDGIPYGEIPSDKLVWVANNSKTPPEKKQAATLILKSRNVKGQ